MTSKACGTAKLYAEQGDSCSVGQRAKAFGHRRTGCLNWARPGLWGERRETAASTRNVKDLHAKIGQLAMENDFLSVALGRIAEPSARK